MPKFEVGSFDGIFIERPTAKVDDADVEKAMQSLAERSQDYEPKTEGAKAAKGDKLTIDFTGKLDGEPFEGGSGGDVDIVLGSGSFIPGFEEQLEGAGSGDERLVKVQFPKDYSAQNLAGKDAEFDVIIKAISSPKTMEIGEELAKKYGFESFEVMKTAVRGNLEADFEKGFSGQNETCFARCAGFSICF